MGLFLVSICITYYALSAAIKRGSEILTSVLLTGEQASQPTPRRPRLQLS